MAQHHTPGRQGRGPQRRNQRQGRYHGNDRKSGYRSHHNQSKPVKLTFFQKLLKFVGLSKLVKPKQAPASTKSNTRVARTRQSRPSAPKQPVTSPRLYVGNLSYEATESDLEDLFKGVGAVKSVEVIYNPRTHKSKGYAFIEMQFLEDAVRAVEVLHDQLFMGRMLTVSAANERQEQPKESAPAAPEAQEQTPSEN